MTFISRMFDFRIISEILNSRTGTCTVLILYTLFSRGNEFAKISENKVFAKIFGFTVCVRDLTLCLYYNYDFIKPSKMVAVFVPSKNGNRNKGFRRCSSKIGNRRPTIGFSHLGFRSGIFFPF